MYVCAGVCVCVCVSEMTRKQFCLVHGAPRLLRAGAAA